MNEIKKTEHEFLYEPGLIVDIDGILSNAEIKNVKNGSVKVIITTDVAWYDRPEAQHSETSDRQLLESIEEKMCQLYIGMGKILKVRGD